MAIDKVSGTSWTSLSEINDTAKASILKFADQEAPSGTPVTGYTYFRFQVVDSSGNPTTNHVYLREVYLYDYYDARGNDVTHRVLTSATSDSNWTVSSGYVGYIGLYDYRAFNHSLSDGWSTIGILNGSDHWLQIKSETGAIDVKSISLVVNAPTTAATHIKVMGSNTGVFGGEETVFATFSNISNGSGDVTYTTNTETVSYDVVQTGLLADFRVQAEGRNHASKIIDYTGSGYDMDFVGTYGIVQKEGVYCGQGDGVDDKTLYRNTNPNLTTRGEGFSYEGWVLHDSATMSGPVATLMTQNFRGHQNHSLWFYVVSTNHASIPGRQTMRLWDTLYSTSLPYTGYRVDASQAIYAGQTSSTNTVDLYTDNTWTHYAVTIEYSSNGNTFDTYKCTIYKNGTAFTRYWESVNNASSTSGYFQEDTNVNQMASNTFNCNSTYPNEWSWGVRSGSLNKAYAYDDGCAAEARIYRGVLSSSDVAANYNATKARYGHT